MGAGSQSAHRPLPWPVRIVAAAVVAELLALFVFDLRASFWLVALLAGSVVLLIYGIWDHRHGPSAIRAALTQRWMTLAGARSVVGGIHVHDGLQPLDVRLGTEASANSVVVLTPVADSEMAFRIWPDTQLAPPFSGSMTRFQTAPTLERAIAIEQKFAGLLRIEVNDPIGIDSLLTGPLMAPILAVRKAAPDEFKGVTWDGERLGIHWWGPIVGDPERALQLSRPIWRAWM